MQIFLLIMKLIPYVIGLVQLAEETFTKPHSGVEKKAAVTAAVQLILAGITGVSTGGQLELWQRIAPHVSTMIDAMAAIYFPPAQISAPDAG
jgi:hypothetical protein